MLAHYRHLPNDAAESAYFITPEKSNQLGSVNMMSTFGWLMAHNDKISSHFCVQNASCSLWNGLRSVSSEDMRLLRCSEWFLAHFYVANPQVLVLRYGLGSFPQWTSIFVQILKRMSKSNSDAPLNIDPLRFICFFSDALRIKDRPKWKETERKD